MKIGIISTTVFKIPIQGYGGLEAVAWERAKGLAKKGHEVTLFAPDGSTCPGCNVIEFGPEQRINEQHAYAGFPEIKEGDKVLRQAFMGYWPELLKQDLIIDDSWNKWSYLLKQEGRLKAPILGVMHAPVNTMFQTPPPVEKPCIVCISEDQKNHYEALFSPHKAKVALHGIDLDFYKPLDIPRSKRFLFLARFSSVKCPDLAIQACRQAGVGLDLVGDTKLTGEAEYLESIKGMVDWDTKGKGWGMDEGLGEKEIRLQGPASRGETVWWYSQAHCMVHLNSRFREPYGLAPVESQACNSPVLCWDYGAMRETVKHGETGFVVSSVQEATELIRSGAIDSLDRRKCRDWVASEFTLDIMVRRYEELCQQAIEGGW